jgi:uncharacterized protein YndB with AHSA1/START domain
MTTNVVTPDQDTVVAEIHIAAPAERVFAAITDPAQLIQWWGQRELYRGTKWMTDLQPGGKWRCEGVGADGAPFHVSGEYVEVDPPRLVVHTWIASYMGDLTTTVRWELKPENGGTRVIIRHSGFASNPEAGKNHGQGWVRVLGWMQGFVEKGATVDSRGRGGETQGPSTS